MKLIDVKKLLDDDGYKYTQTIVPSRADFYRQKGFTPSEIGARLAFLSHLVSCITILVLLSLI